ncbi:hypothetical protein P1S61_39160 [Streptomyces sp. ME08-AFT2]|uniref:hypothetical protein n=1 Tax=Streptomyces sp. ME08-AFT2 TaxID=3028683 RepID=UPI0029B99717|nr:hypothetical protein [Streptomyces sp. ME08-AFT2]MDX3314973.1 hypothetical protein [Streptomyces sp. ME08-AFT2]
MPADEVSTGSDVDAARVRSTGPRHAAPKKPLFTRLHMPAGKAIALAAMPTAVLMGMGFTPTLANAEGQPASKSLTADEYKDCVAALAEADASPSASASESADDSKDDAKDSKDSKDDAKDSKDSEDGSKSSDDSKGTAGDSGKGGSASSDSGSDDAATPSPAASSAPDKSATSADSTTTTPTDTETSKNVLETIGDAITGLFDGKDSDDATTEANPSPSASAPAAGDSTSGSGSSDTSRSGSSGTDSSSGKSSSGKSSSGTAKDTADAVTDKAKDTAEDAADKAEDTAKDAKDTAADATPSPSASKAATTDADDCPAATDDEGGIDNGKVALPDEPWFLNASSLLLKGADYQGVVKVKTANGTVKEVLKYVISDGTDIGDLHQTVNDKQSGRTYHVQAGKGTTSTIRDGDTIMYTESISGNLFGLIPVTFSPKSPPPLNIPLIYFTNVKVQQAGQFGGTLTVPGLHQFTTAG